MKIKLVSFADKNFYKSQKVLNKSALKNGVDETLNYNDTWLRNQKQFYLTNKKILDNPRGAGYWLWKPYIILDALKNKMDDNDVLLYIDSGTIIVNNVSPIVEIAIKKDIVLFNNDGHKNTTWTKRDCFYYMNCDTENYHDGEQVSACYISLKKTKAVVNFVSEWLEYSTDERIISDNPNICGLSNFEDFKDHRHDQSILSILAIKNNIELFRDPSQWGNRFKLPEHRVINEFINKDYVETPFLNSNYPTILNAHRAKLPLTFLDRIEYNFSKIIYLIKGFF